MRRVVDRRDLVDHHVTSLSLLIKERCPEAEMEISFTRYEDEDAHIWVFPPETLGEAERDRLWHEIADKSLDILLESGVLILTGVFQPDQRSEGRR
jgi:hypothetical protein